MTTYFILIVYLRLGGKIAYPYTFPTMTACSIEAEAQMERPDAILGVVCVEHRRIIKVSK